MIEPALSQAERNRRHMHHAIDTCLGAWDYARLAARSLGFPTGPTEGHGSIGGHGDPTSLVGAVDSDDKPDPGRIAIKWLCDLFDVLSLFIDGADWKETNQLPVWWSTCKNPAQVGRVWHESCDRIANGWPDTGNVERSRLFGLADMAAQHWPPPPKPGDKIAGVTVWGRPAEACALCGTATVAGRVRWVKNSVGVPEAFCKSPCWYTVTTDRGIHPRQLKKRRAG